MRRVLYLCLIMCFTIINFPHLAANKTNYYCDTSYFNTGGDAVYEREEISFNSYTTDDIFMDRTCPSYKNLTQVNSCAPMAASIVVGYYDYEFPNLIPNHDAGFYLNGRFFYKAQDQQVIDAKEKLYDCMGTNSVAPGTSVKQFKSGLTQYVNNQGYNISISNCGKKFDLEQVKQSFRNQQPVVLFLNSYTYYDYNGISLNTNSMSMLRLQKDAGHVVVAYGFKQYKFYKNNSLFRTDNYLVVCMGDGTEGYLSINSTASIDETLSIRIF